MTTSVDKAKITLPGNNDRTIFYFDFMVPEGASVSVWISLNGADEIDDTSNAVIALNEDQKDFPGGTVEYPVSGDTLTADDNIIIKRDSLFTQLVSYEENTPLDMESIETQFDIASLERQGIKSRVRDLVPVTPIAVPQVSDSLLYGVIKLGRPFFEYVDGFNLDICGGAFTISSSENPALGFVVNNRDTLRYFTNTLIKNTTYYLYLDYNEVVKSGGTMLTLSMLSHSTTVPTVPTDGRDGYYCGDKKCIFMLRTVDYVYLGLSAILPFTNDSSELIMYKDHKKVASVTLTNAWQKVYLGKHIPSIVEKALITVRTSVDPEDVAELWMRSSPNGAGHLAADLWRNVALQMTTYIGYDSAEDCAYLEFKTDIASTTADKIWIYVNGYYLPRGV